MAGRNLLLFHAVDQTLRCGDRRLQPLYIALAFGFACLRCGKGRIGFGTYRFAGGQQIEGIRVGVLEFEKRSLEAKVWIAEVRPIGFRVVMKLGKCGRKIGGPADAWKLCVRPEGERTDQHGNRERTNASHGVEPIGEIAPFPQPRPSVAPRFTAGL